MPISPVACDLYSSKEPMASKRKEVGDYRHEEATRLNNPTAALACEDLAPIPERTFSFDPHVHPQLVWAGKAEQDGLAVEAPSIHVHERLSTEAIIKATRRENAQIALFADPGFERLPNSRTELRCAGGADGQQRGARRPLCRDDPWLLPGSCNRTTTRRSPAACSTTCSNATSSRATHGSAGSPTSGGCATEHRHVRHVDVDPARGRHRRGGTGWH